MLKRMTGNGMKKELMKKVNAGALIHIKILTACEAFCDSRCGEGPCMTDSQENGQDIYQSDE